MRAARSLAFAFALAWMVGCATSRNDSASRAADAVGEGRTAVVMEENVIGGYAWLDNELDLRAVRFEDAGGLIGHALLVAAPTRDAPGAAEASLVVEADGRRHTFVPEPSLARQVRLGGASGVLYPVRLEHLRSIARADTVVVEWRGAQASLTRTFNAENSARFGRWLAQVTPPSPPASEPGSTPSGGAAAAKAGGDAPATPARRVRVVVPAANVRAGPGTAHEVVTVLVRDVVVDVRSRRGPWFEVSTGEVKGFLHRFTLEELEGAAAGRP